MEKDHEEYNIGVLDIYGFEIFQVRKAGEGAEWRGSCRAGMKTSVQILSTHAKIAADTCNLDAVEGRDRALWGLLATSPALGLVGDCLKGIRQGVITPYQLCIHSEGSCIHTHEHTYTPEK